MRSHLIPAALYAYCRQGDHRPISFANGVLIPSDRQTQDYLLCHDCEDILSRGGEAWMGDKLATWSRTFPLYDLVAKQPAIINESDITVHSVTDGSEISVQKLTHFALGIFWKASVHSWRGGESAPQIELGPYSDKLRKWVRGELRFPTHMYLIVEISRPGRAQIAFTAPYEGKRGGWHSYFLHLPGMMFALAVGRTVDQVWRELCFWNNSAHPILVCDELTQHFEQLMVRRLRSSRKTAAFLRAKAKADVARKQRPS